MDKFEWFIIGALLFTIIGGAFLINWSINRKQEITVEKTIIVISTSTTKDIVFDYDYTTLALFSTGDRADYMKIWGSHLEFEAWHKYKISYRLKFGYGQMYAELLSVEPLGEVPIPTE